MKTPSISFQGEILEFDDNSLMEGEANNVLHVNVIPSTTRTNLDSTNKYSTPMEPVTQFFQKDWFLKV